jgi:hypothetical protein
MTGGIANWIVLCISRRWGYGTRQGLSYDDLRALFRGRIASYLELHLPMHCSWLRHGGSEPFATNNARTIGLSETRTPSADFGPFSERASPSRNGTNQATQSA